MCSHWEWEKLWVPRATHPVLALSLDPPGSLSAPLSAPEAEPHGPCSWAPSQQLPFGVTVGRLCPWVIGHAFPLGSSKRISFQVRQCCLPHPFGLSKGGSGPEWVQCPPCAPRPLQLSQLESSLPWWDPDGHLALAPGSTEASSHAAAPTASLDGYPGGTPRTTKPFSQKGGWKPERPHSEQGSRVHE